MSQLVSATQIEALLPDDHAIWLVLERHPQTFKRLYELAPAPDVQWLFHDTCFAESADQSPLVVRTTPGSELLTAFASGQGAPPLEGIVVSSSASPERVIAHLRQRLQIRFYGKRQALLRYYDPWIAAAFFSADNAQDTWLGPLERVIWFGGSFVQRAQQGACWYACHGGSDKAAPVAQDDAAPLALSPAQEQALEDFVADYPLWRHLMERAALDETSADHAGRFVSALDEAGRLAIPEQDLAEFVALRFAHHHTPLPDTLMAKPADERLAMLKRHVEAREDETTIGRHRA